MTDILVRVKSVFFVELPVSKFGQVGWVNLALVTSVDHSTEDGTVRLSFVDGNKLYEHGDRAEAILNALREQSARTSL
jgi:hypothetical protein